MKKKLSTPTKLTELIPDDKNFNKGSEAGKLLIKKSIEKFGAGRSILLDKNNRIMGGNKFTENAIELGLNNLQIVDSDGTKVIGVRRMDIDFETDHGREFALADNATAKMNIVFDAEVIDAELGEALAEEWVPGISGVSDKGFDDKFNLPGGGKKPFQQMTFTFADEQAEFIQKHLNEAKKIKAFKLLDCKGNENSNGNAFFLIVKQWAAQKK